MKFAIAALLFTSAILIELCSSASIAPGFIPELTPYNLENGSDDKKRLPIGAYEANLTDVPRDSLRKTEKTEKFADAKKSEEDEKPEKPKSCEKTPKSVKSGHKKHSKHSKHSDKSDTSDHVKESDRFLPLERSYGTVGWD